VFVFSFTSQRTARRQRRQRRWLQVFGRRRVAAAAVYPGHQAAAVAAVYPSHQAAAVPALAAALVSGHRAEVSGLQAVVAAGHQEMLAFRGQARAQFSVILFLYKEIRPT